MAANLDKSESSLSSVSDVAYVRGLDSSGNSVKISKSDLASVLGVYHSSISTWDVTRTLDTGIKAKIQTLLLLFRCQTSSSDGDFYSFIIPITVGNLKANIWRGDAISIRETASFPTSAIQFSVSNNGTINVTGVYGNISITAIATL